jgi:hypothetical protein
VKSAPFLYWTDASVPRVRRAAGAFDADLEEAGVDRSSWGRSIPRGPAALTRMCVQAALDRCAKCKVFWVVECLLLGYSDV